MVKAGNPALCAVRSGVSQTGELETRRCVELFVARCVFIAFERLSTSFRVVQSGVNFTTSNLSR